MNQDGCQIDVSTHARCYGLYGFIPLSGPPPLPPFPPPPHLLRPHTLSRDVIAEWLGGASKYLNFAFIASLKIREKIMMHEISIGNRMNASAFRDLWALAWAPGTSDVLKVFKIARAVGECNLKNFQNITSDHKSRNARAVHAIFCLLYSQQNHSVTLLCKP